jgi:hypothetical protein
MTISSTELLNDLIERTLKNSKAAEKFNALSIEELNLSIAKDSWTILECLEHLNLYGDFYLPEIKKRIENSKTNAAENFKSGILGNYFAQMMLPKEQVNKMKTFTSMNPTGSKLDKTTVTRFITQQEQLLKILEQAKKIDLNKTKTSISISKLIKLKLGDTFKVIIYHNERHIAQAKKIVAIKAVQF